MDMVALALENVALSLGEPFFNILHTYNKARNEGERWSEKWARVMKAAVDRVSLALSSNMDSLYHQIQTKAEKLGKELETDKAYLTNFGEEVVRGMPAYALSQLLACLDPLVRNAAKMSAWELAGNVKKAGGTVSVMEDIVGIQGKSFDTPQVGHNCVCVYVCMCVYIYGIYIYACMYMYVYITVCMYI
jgi:alpha-glucan,water dikinase